jgi:hypothetical protein
MYADQEEGFRVELDGVSACLAACPGVHRATALMVAGELVGILTPRTCNIDLVKEHLTVKLPYYAIPTKWHPLDEFPLTPNGKVDKRALTREVKGMNVEEKATYKSEKPPIVSREKSSSSDCSSSSSLPKEPHPLPGKTLNRPWRGLRHRIFVVYRTLFSFVWLTNIITLICFLALSSIGRRHISTIAFANLTVAILVRQDMVINTLYTVCCSLPTSWPLAIRRRCAKIYHLGGVHSGAATMAVAWYAGDICYNIYRFVKRSDEPSRPSVLTITLSLIALTIFLIMLVFAYPTIRKKHHNTFERVHRFAGWTALAIIWVQTMSSIRDNREPTQSFAHTMISTPSFWMLILITLSIASSWFFLRTVPVDAEVLSNHAVRLHFDYTIPVMGTFTRLSERPLIEWHSFATVPAPRVENGRSKGYSLVVSRAGDWTGGRISKPPRRIWVRGIPSNTALTRAPPSELRTNLFR